MSKPIRDHLLPKSHDGHFYLVETSNIIERMTLKFTAAGRGKIQSRKIKSDGDMIQTINTVAHYNKSVLIRTSV